MEFSTNLQDNIDYLHKKLNVQNNFDVVYRTLHIGGLPVLYRRLCEG